MRLSHVPKLTLSVFYILLPFFDSYAQEYLANIQYFGIEDGLSHRDVYDIHQDKDGFIWVGTKYGLNRFDGYEFKWYTKEKNGLGSNTVHHILADAEDNLWLFESYNWYYFDDIQSVSILDIQKDTIQTFEERFKEESPIRIEDIKFAVTSDNGKIYFGIGDGGLVSYHPHEGWKMILERGSIMFQPHLFTDNHTIWGFGDDFSLVEIDTLGKVMKSIDLSNYINPNQEVRVFIIDQDIEENLWVRIILSSKPVILKINVQSSSVEIQNYQNEDFITSDPFSNLFYRSSEDVFWYTGNPKLFVWKPDVGIVFDLASYYPELSAGEIHDIYFDQFNRAWISSFYGLFQVQLYESPFKQFLYNNNPNQPSSDFFSCRGIFANDTSVLANTYKGLQLIREEGQDIQQIPELRWPNKYSEHFRYLVLPHAMMRDSKGNYWFGDQGVVFADSMLKNFKVFPYLNDEIGGSVWSIHEDEKGRIWVGTERGLGVLDTNQNVCIPFRLEEPYDELNNSQINFICKGKQDTLYLGTTSGFYIFHPEQGIVAKYGMGEVGEYQLPSDDIRHFFIDNDEYIWLATYGGGLVKLDLKKDHASNHVGLPDSHYQQFTIADGLSNNNLYAVYPDDYGNFWLSSDYGIIVFNKESYQSRAFLPEDGTTHHEFNTISHFKDENGQLYFGSLNGITTFQPSDVLKIEQTFDVPLVIRGLQQFDKDVQQIVDKSQAIREEKSITLRPGERFFDLQFALLTYEHTDKVRYVYRIGDFQNTWTYTSEPAIRFGALPYGKHILHIRAQGPDGRFSTSELRIPIDVQAPFYLRWWFRALCILLVCAIVYSFYKQRTLALKKRQKALKKAVEEATEIIRKQNERLIQDKTTIEKQAEELRHLDKVKSRFFANISHELRTPLTLLLGPINSLLNKEEFSPQAHNLLKLAQRNAQELLKLINEILDLSKLEADKLQVEEQVVDFYSFVRKTTASFEAISSMRRIKFTFQYQADPSLKLELDQGKFQKVLNNLLANAFKYTEDEGEISLIIKDETSHIHLCIEDSGRGIAQEDLPHIFNRFYQSNQENIPAEGGTGIGLALSKELIALLNGKIWVESKLGEGSKFFVEFPKKEVLGSRNASIINPLNKEINAYDVGYLQKEEVATKVPNREIILLVEDHLGIQEYIQTILGDTYELVVAQNGKEALEILGSRQPRVDSQPFKTAGIQGMSNASFHVDLIISDIMMPIMDGFQLLEALKKDDTYQQIPIIMLTAKAGVEDKMKALRMGVDDYILKPFEEEELSIRVQNLLHNAKARKNVGLQNDDIITKEKEELTPIDRTWLEAQEILLKENISDHSFSISQWSELTHMSERNLQRKIKQFTGLSPYQYIMEIRLQEGRRILEMKTYRSLSEVAYTVGFSNLRAFSRNFKKRFGKIPSEYV